MNQNLITPQELSSRWTIGTKTLSQWRWSGKGPQFLKLGKRIMYRMQDVENFEKESLFKSTVQYGREERNA